MNKKYLAYLFCFVVIGICSSITGNGVSDDFSSFIVYCAPYWACLSFSFIYGGKQ